MSASRVFELLNATLKDLMAEDDDIYLLGEDIVDPYGGAFKVTKGLSSLYPGRVLATPISEAGITGVGVGLALRGLKAIVEIMFGDFMTLAADQLINQAAKLSSMYGSQLDLAMVVRTPMGGRRGYGPTHSQSLERLFFGVPGLSVVALSHLTHPGDLLRRALHAPGGPVVFIENKLIYLERLLDARTIKERFNLTRVGDTSSHYETVVLGPEGKADITIVAYGGTTPLVLEAVRRLAETEELACEVVVPHELSPLDSEPIVRSVKQTRRLVVAEEGVEEFGFGAEVVARVSAVSMEAPPIRVGAARRPISASRAMENAILPGVDDIMEAAIRTVDEEHL